MTRFVRCSFIFLLISSLFACTTTPTSAPATATPTAQPTLHIPLAELSSPALNAELEQLIQSQNARTNADVVLYRKWHMRPTLAWNAQARYWVSYYGMDAVVASRVYALVSVSQQRALDSLAQADNDFTSRIPSQLDSTINPITATGNPFESAVILGATEPVFLYLFNQTPNEITAVFAESRATLLASGNILPNDLKALEAFGNAIATDLIAQRTDDGSAVARNFDTLPTGEGIWKPDVFRTRPEQPGWGKVTPWLMTSPDQFRASPPPEFGSPAFTSALADLRTQQQNNTPGQLAIAQKWADKRFTYTPPGHWNLIAEGLIKKYNLSDREASRVLALLNISQMDAGIACWDSKYHYMVIRPWQADLNISALVGYPNHPSYPSGHSCFSSASAKALSYFFPTEHESLWAMAEEASISRFYGGIHYRFDMEAGKEIGRQIGSLAEQYARGNNWEPTNP